MHVDPDQGRRIRVDFAGHERVVDPTVGPRAEGHEAELAEIGGQPAFAHALHRLLVEHPVLDEVRDGAEPESMGLGEALQVGAPGHGPVLVEDLDEDRGRLEPGQAR